MQTLKNEYTSFSALYGIFFKIDQVLEYQESLSKYGEIEIISYPLSDSN